LLNG
jgi:ribonuclease HI